MDDIAVSLVDQEPSQPNAERSLLAPLYDVRWPLAAAVVAMGIFVLELRTGLNTVAAVLHPLAILLCLRGPEPRISLVAAGVLSILTTIAALAVPTPAPERLATELAGVLLVTWLSAAFVYRFAVLARDRVDRSLKALADTKYALDQAAIVATTDTRGTIKSVNRRFCEISKYSAEELIGQDHRIINSGYHPKSYIRGLWRTIAQGRIWTGELRNRAKDGSIYWVDTTIVPFLDQRGKPYQYMAIHYDITRRKQSEQKLHEQEALARLGQMAAVVAHEVKNPLAGIRGVLQVIGTRMPEESRDRQIIGELLARLDSLNEMVQDLLLFARPTEPQRRIISPHTVLQATIDLLHEDPAALGVEVTVEGPNAPAFLDPKHLGTVLLNLLLNAAQAMGGEGRVAVEVRPAGTRVQIRVHDAGPGIPDEVLGRVFEPFFTTRHRGTGLGLPTARRLVELNEGEIEVSSPPGGGTLIVMSFPAAPQGAPSRSPEDVRRAGRGTGVG